MCATAWAFGHTPLCPGELDDMIASGKGQLEGLYRMPAWSQPGASKLLSSTFSVFTVSSWVASILEKLESRSSAVACVTSGDPMRSAGHQLRSMQ